LAFYEEERFNRIKHAKKATIEDADKLPEKALESLFEDFNLGWEDIDYIGFSLDPKSRYDKNVRHKHPYKIKEGDYGSKEGEKLFREKIESIERKIRELGFKGKFYYLNHHLCHAASAYYVSGFKDSAVLVVDGIGEFESTTIWKGSNGKLTKIKEINYPNSLGFLWEKFSKYLGFTEYDAAKVMGLSAYGDKDKFLDKFRKIIKIKEDGSFEVDDNIVRFRIEDYSELEKLFGVKKREEPIKYVNEETKIYADIAASLQYITEEIMIKLARFAKNKLKTNNLAIAGGVALNCVANAKVIDEKIFDNVFVLPPANDAGTALGAAYLIWHEILKNKYEPFEERLKNAFLGKTFTESEIKRALEKAKKEGLIEYKKIKEPYKVAAKLIAEGKIIAWYQRESGSEIGPRALGNSSILADPRNKKMWEILNDKVKFREPFRPLCPSVLCENVGEWFEGRIEDPHRFMIAVLKVKKDKWKKIPAVIHVDGTARLQVVRKEDNPKYYNLIREFKEITGIPMVLNTSFNVREPIVNSPQDAINTFLKTKIDYLIMGDYLVYKK